MIFNNDHKSFGTRIKLVSPNGYGSTNTMIRKYTTVEVNNAIGFTLTQSATNGDSITINMPGLYFIQASDIRTGGGSTAGISVNSNQLTTSILTITAAHRITYSGGITNELIEAKCFYYAAINDVIRHHNNGLDVGTASNQVFEVIRIS
jgi:hypothetical protein